MKSKNELINEILREYELKEKKRKDEEHLYKETIYSSYPRLREIDEELKSEFISQLKYALSDDKSCDISKKIQDLLIEKNEFMSKNKIQKFSSLINYSCEKCNDSGIIIDENGNSKYCSCFKNKFVSLAFKNSNLAENFEKYSFENFNTEIFDNNAEYNGITQRINQLSIKKRLENYIETFDKKNQKSLVFYGNTGTGKTYMSVCLAKKIVQKGYTAIYIGATELFDRLGSYFFSFDKENHSERVFAEYIYDCDFLIIDDLGTEMTNTFVKSRLGDIINSRIIKEQKTLISTNFTPDLLSETYDKRIHSRLEENYEFYEFIGNDIRQK